jgi:hypothetical protein
MKNMPNLSSDLINNFYFRYFSIQYSVHSDWNCITYLKLLCQFTKQSFMPYDKAASGFVLYWWSSYGSHSVLGQMAQDTSPLPYCVRPISPRLLPLPFPTGGGGGTAPLLSLAGKGKFFVHNIYLKIWKLLLKGLSVSPVIVSAIFVFPVTKTVRIFK